jgi:predicted amidohydrolase YtcJ
MVDFSSCRHKDQMLAQIRKQADQLPEGRWILGYGLQLMPNELPGLAELDEASQAHPLLIARPCYHAYLANTIAAKRAGVNPDSDVPEEGAYGKTETGLWNGMVYEGAVQLFQKAQPKPTYEEKKETMRLAMKEALACGLTAVHTDDLRYIESLPQLIQMMHELVAEGVKLRTHHLVYHPYLDEVPEVLPESPWFRLGAVKIFADGSLGARTAWLSEPYMDEPDTCGIAVHSPEELKEIALRSREKGLPVAVHAIGDKAAEVVIKVMGNVQAPRLRHRLIHAQILRPELIGQLKRLPIAVDIQPRFVASDFPWVTERIGPRKRTLYAWKTLLSEGIICAGGSDAPIEPIHPLLGMEAAVTRRGLDGKTYGEEERLDLAEALALFTIGSAQAAAEEAERGTLEAGKYADMTVYDRDLFDLEPGELHKARTWFTIVNGQIAYSLDLAE